MCQVTKLAEKLVQHKNHLKALTKSKNKYICSNFSDFKTKIVLVTLLDDIKFQKIMFINIETKKDPTKEPL